MAPRRVEEIPVKRVAALGCKLPDQLPAGVILTDITQNKWKLGHAIGYGGFGDIYLGTVFLFKFCFIEISTIHSQINRNVFYVFLINYLNFVV